MYLLTNILTRRGRLFVDPRGRGASVPKQLIQRLRIWGWEERERGRREGGLGGWTDEKRWGWKEMQSVAVNTGVFSPQTEERISRDIGRNWPGQIKLSQRPTVIPPHLSWERKLLIELRPNTGKNMSRRKYGQYADSTINERQELSKRGRKRVRTTARMKSWRAKQKNLKKCKRWVFSCSSRLSSLCIPSCLTILSILCLINVLVLSHERQQPLRAKMSSQILVHVTENNKC